MTSPGRGRSDLLQSRSALLGRWVHGLLMATLFLLCAGCETLDSRLARNEALFRGLPTEHQTLIQQGRLQVGFTPTEVYLAWGAPTRKSVTENEQGSQEIWSYTATQTETYYREESYFDWGLGVWRSFDRPIYRYREYLYQEATFTNGRLTSFTIHPAAFQP